MTFPAISYSPEKCRKNAVNAMEPRASLLVVSVRAEAARSPFVGVHSSSDSAIGALDPGFMSLILPIPMSSTGAGTSFN